MNNIEKRLLTLLSYASRKGSSRLPCSSEERIWSEEDWEAIAAKARRFGLAPLLYHRIKLREPDIVVPPQVVRKLRDDYLFIAAANMRRFHAAKPALEALKAAGVPTIVLKGAYLAEAVYGNLALRPMSDVDLLVHREDLGNADAALATAGLSAREFHISPPEDEIEFHYQDAAARVMIEVHWEMTKPDYPFRLDVGPLWESAVPARIAGVDVLALSPEDLLIHIGLHAAIHRFAFGPRPLCDLAEAVSRLAVNWDLLGKRAWNAGVGRAVWLLLALTAELFQATIPESGLKRIAPSPLPAGLWEEAKETVFKDESEQTQRTTPHPNLVLFMGRKRWRDKCALVARRIFPSRQSIAAQYPVRADSPRVFLYYPASFRVLFKNNAPALRALFFGRRKRPLIDKKAAALMDWMLSRD
jgi:hypothetical protein